MDPSNTEKRLRQLRLAVHGAAALGLAGLLLAAWWLLLRPLKADQYLASTRLSRLHETIASADRVRAEHDELEKQLADVQHREAMLRARLPDDPSEEEFLALASALADGAGLTIKDYRPGKATPGLPCSSLRVEMIGEGDYESICRFLDGLAKLPRRSAVAKLHIDAKDKQKIYHVEVSVLLYFGTGGHPTATGRVVPNA